MVTIDNTWKTQNTLRGLFVHTICFRMDNADWFKIWNELSRPRNTKPLSSKIGWTSDRINWARVYESVREADRWSDARAAWVAAVVFLKFQSHV
jgi:hypothetical protein